MLQFFERLLPVLIFSMVSLTLPPTVESQEATSSLTEEHFDALTAGDFKTLSSAVGHWQVKEGRCLIDDQHAKTGKQCLQVAGGERTVVELEVADGVDTSGTLSFWAERWTSRQPFSFRIEKFSQGEWSEVYNGDREVIVGRAFKAFVKVPLRDKKIERLRLRVTSPPDTGVLLDHFRFAPSMPQRVVAVEVVPMTLPVLVGRSSNPLLKLRITTEGELNPIRLDYLVAHLSDASLKAGAEVLEVRLGQGGSYDTAQSIPYTKETNGLGKTKLRLSRDGSELGEGENEVWIGCKLRSDSDLDARIETVCSELGFAGQPNVKIPEARSVQRLGVAVRQGGDDGVHTYRIPGLATTTQGTLLGVYDVRRRNGGDLPGDIDVGMSRSIDGGRTWEPMKIIMDMGSDSKWRYDGIGDPSILVDQETGTIWVAALWSHGNRGWHGSGPGLEPQETGQLILVRSDDDGVTWSEPINITRQVKNPDWTLLLQGPGKGIAMRDGTLVFPAQFQAPLTQKRLPHSTVIYSKDHGETWHIGTPAYPDTTEAQVIEVEPGVLMLNCRYNRKSARVVMMSRDLGATWTEHPTSQKNLIEPGACMASLIDVRREQGGEGGDWLLFSNPDSLSGRQRMMIKASTDAGLSWPKEHRVLLDEGRSAGYSCLSMIDDETVGILYEGSQSHMTFQRVKLSELGGQAAEQEERASELPPQSHLLLPKVFGDHMVLQAGQPIQIWGRGKAGQLVNVQLGNEKVSTQIDETGAWSAAFPSRPASWDPTDLKIRSSGEEKVFGDVLIGEVWLCAGQSNMQWPLASTVHGAEATSTANESGLRLLNLEPVSRGGAEVFGPQQLQRLNPDRFLTGQWCVADADSASSFSGVGWYFGRRLASQLRIPVGLINVSAGGSPTEAWISSEALRNDPVMKPLVQGSWLDNPGLTEFCQSRALQNLLPAIQAGERVPCDEMGPDHTFKPGFLWEAAVRPLVPFPLRGVIWYQGESNAETLGRAEEHAALFRLMIESWREAWQRPELPFLYVQLPGMGREHWPVFREGQRKLLRELDHVGMAVTLDVGVRSDVHPRLKQPVGDRLATLALAKCYEMDGLEMTGPLVLQATRQGASVVLDFESCEQLVSLDGGPLRHFELAGEDGVYYAAKSEIFSATQLKVQCEEVAVPVRVRYAWIGFPEPAVNLFNRSGLPASPFEIRVLDP
jgi:sialidase-1